MKVPSICRSTGASSALPGVLVFFLTCYVCSTDSAQFKVVGPNRPVTAMVGEDIVLPCHLTPTMSAENMEVTWFRSELSPFVHRYSGGKDQYKQQMPEYQGRTELLKGGLANGNVALKIFHVRVSDEGRYNCLVRDGLFYRSAVLELQVAASGSAPHVSIEDYQDGRIRVVCRVAGWYPEPKVMWRDLNGQAFPSASHTNSRDANGLYGTQTSAVIKKNSNQNLCCLVKSTRLSQEKESLCFISDPFFPKANPWMVCLAVTLVVLLGSVALSVYLFKVKEKQAAELRWRRSVFPLEEANVTLDPDTAHPRLIVSEDGKCVKCGETEQPLPGTRERFDTRECVLGREGFTSGRHSWEVEVEVLEGRFWAVGVARESVGRKGGISLSPENGIWAVRWWWDEFQALTDPHTRLPVRPPSRIRICLDCDRGQVMFLDDAAEAPILTFPPGSLPGERIRPWAWVWDRKTQLRLCP